MGHIRVGRLPKTRRWREVTDLLADSPSLTGAVAAAVTEAADRRLSRLADDTALNDAFWLLTRISWASHGTNFSADLRAIGLKAPRNSSTLGFISDLSDRVRLRNAAQTDAGHFAELSSLALRGALVETVGEQGGSLFGSQVEDVQAAFRKYSTRTGFGVLSHRFFGELFARTLRSVIDRELPNNLGESHAMRTLAEGEEFMQALDTYARQASRVMQNFAESWYSRHNWESKGEITPDEARGFVAHALAKLRMDLKLGIIAA